MTHLKVNDAEIYYEVHGHGAPFLFCSVTGLDHQAWKFHQVREFSQDHKVIVFDYRGTGKSSKAVQKYSIKMFTDDAAAILDHLGVEQPLFAVTPWVVWWHSYWHWITPTKLASSFLPPAVPLIRERRAFLSPCAVTWFAWASRNTSASTPLKPAGLKNSSRLIPI